MIDKLNFAKVYFHIGLLREHLLGRHDKDGMAKLANLERVLDEILYPSETVEVTGLAEVPDQTIKRSDVGKNTATIL
jgi:hypothetical protein